jgi:hypothetical protein
MHEAAFAIFFYFEKRGGNCTILASFFRIDGHFGKII